MFGTAKDASKPVTSLLASLRTWPMVLLNLGLLVTTLAIGCVHGDRHGDIEFPPKDESLYATKETGTKKSVRYATSHFTIHTMEGNRLEAAKVIPLDPPFPFEKEADVDIPMSLEQSLAPSERSYLFTIQNRGNEPVTLHFGSGQAFDATLSDINGIVWRWSEDKGFTMALWDTEVKPGGVLVSEFELPSLPVGTYILKAWSVAKEARAIPPAELEVLIEGEASMNRTTEREHQCNL